MAVVQKLVTAEYLVPNGAGAMVPAAGSVRFIPSTTVYDAEGNVITPPQPVEIDLVDGVLQVNLLVTDDPDTQPIGWAWLVKELFPGGREYAIEVPSAGLTTLALTSLAPAEEVPAVFSYASLAALVALQAQVDALEVEAGVRHVVEFVSTGTWTCPAGVFAADVEIVGGGAGAGGGGGGAGGGSNGSTTFGGGGGGGAGGGAAVHRSGVAIPVTPGDTYAVVVGAGGASGTSGAGGAAGTSGGAAGAAGGTGAAGGYSEALGLRALGGSGGQGGYPATQSETAQVFYSSDGGNYSGALGGGSSNQTDAAIRAGSNGGSYGAVGGHPFNVDPSALAAELASVNGVRGEAAPLVNDETPGGGAGGGGGGRGSAGLGGAPGLPGGGGTGGTAQSGQVGGLAGSAGANVTGLGSGTTAGSGPAGTAGDAGNHKGAGGHGGGGGAGGGGGPASGSPRNGGAGGPGGAGGAGVAGVVRVIY